MARDYSPKHFYLRTHNHLLERYFRQRHNVLHKIEFKKLNNDKVAAILIFNAVLELPDDKQAQIEGECREIENMAFHGGVTALIEEATHHPHFNTTFPDAINQFDGYYDKAMWTYLEYPQYWLAATSILHAQNISDTYWKRRNDFPHTEPDMKHTAIDQFSTRLSNYFRKKEGRGLHCKIDVFRRGSKAYFFAYLSDFGQSDAEWEGNMLELRARLPTFEIIFVYIQSEGSLDIYALGNTKYIGDFQKIFAATILKLQNVKDFIGVKGAYDFAPLANRDFSFKLPDYSDILSVEITRLRITFMNREKRSIIIIAETKNNPKAIFDTRDSLRLPPHYITQAEITATFATPLPGTRTKKRKFTISYPDSCNLRHEGRDGILRTMLALSGIEINDVVEIEETASA